jgi:hypothetical protein
MKLYSEATPIVLDLDNTHEYDVANSPYANIKYGVQIEKIITIDSKYEANLPGLAHDYYGDQNMWRILMSVNGFTDPLNDVCVGNTVLMPSQASVDAYLAKALPSVVGTVIPGLPTTMVI